MHPIILVNHVKKGSKIMTTFFVLQTAFINIATQLIHYYCQIPSRFLCDIRIIRSNLSWQVKGIKSLGREFVTGKKKAELTEWWLKTIEMRVDEMLQRHAFQLNCLGSDYTSVPPVSMEVVEQNLKILEDVTRSGGKEYTDFITQTTDEIYKVIDPFVDEMKHLLNECQVRGS